MRPRSVVPYQLHVVPAPSPKQPPLARVSRILAPFFPFHRNFPAFGARAGLFSRSPSLLCAAQAVATAAGRPAPPRDAVITTDPANNVTDYIYSKMGSNLHMRPDHPLGIIKAAIYAYFDARHPGKFKKLDDYPAIVSTK